jgi:RNA polymerase sigma factor CnrH
VNAPTPRDDAELAGRALAGDAAAFGELMRRHKADLYRLARRYTGSRDAALEVVQESFVAAWRALGRYDRTRSFRAWLRTIALNKCRDRARQSALRRAIFGHADVDGPEARSRADDARDPEATLLSREQLVALDRALTLLPPALKEPLILTAFQGLSQQEAARMLGLSAKAVEIRVYRARRRLAELLQVDDPGR